jgi:hypothetical protein
MIEKFCRLNVLNSKSLDDVIHFTTPFTNEEGYTTPYFGIKDDKYLDQWKYEDFSYTFNKYGFRYLPLKDHADIGAFGCSFTFGQSMPESRLWHSLLSKNTNNTVLNFGVAGKSIKTIVDIFAIVTSHIKIKKAIFLLPPIHRIQLLMTEDNLTFYRDFYPMSNDTTSSSIFKFLPETEMINVAKSNIYLAEHIAKLRNIEIYFATWNSSISTLLKNMNLEYAKVLPEWTAIPENPHLDKARDMEHPGPLHHERWESLIRPYFL